MILNQVLKISKLLVLIFLVSCSNKAPLITLVQVDATHNQMNPFHISKYDEVNCKLELEPLPSFAIADGANVINPLLHGGVWISESDYAELKKYVVTECKNNHKE